jgi:hypothetical protein
LITIKCIQVRFIKNLNRAKHDYILRPPAVLTEPVVRYWYIACGDRVAQPDGCRGSDGVEFRESGDELVEVTKSEAVGTPGVFLGGIQKVPAGSELQQSSPFGILVTSLNAIVYRTLVSNL